VPKENPAKNSDLLLFQSVSEGSTGREGMLTRLDCGISRWTRVFWPPHFATEMRKHGRNRLRKKSPFDAQPPKGASDFEEHTVSLKRYPDTNLSFSAACKVVTFLESARSKIFPHPAKSARAAHPYFTPIRPAWRPIPSRIANASCSALRPSSNETTGHDRSRTECRKALISASSGSSAVIGGFAIWI